MRREIMWFDRAAQWFRRAATVSAVVVVCAALAAAGQPARAESLKLTMVFPVPPQTTSLPFYVAQDQGWYTEHGLDVTETVVSGDNNAIRMVVTGDGDVALTGPGPMLGAIIGGAKIKSFGSWQPLVDYVVVARDPITSLNQLKGKVIAGVAPGEIANEVPRMMLIRRGIPDNDVSFVSVGFQNARVQAVLAGKGDATMVGLLAAGMGKKSGNLNVIARVKDEFPQLGYIVLAARTADLSNPEKRMAYKLLIQGAIEGARFVMKDPDKAAEVLQNRMKGNVDLDLIKTTIRKLNDLGVWGVNGGADPEVAAYTEKLHRELGVTSKQVEVSNMVDTSLVSEVIKEIGPYEK